jgi:RNA polymerase sigma-70 factor, ECF subfamily
METTRFGKSLASWIHERSIRYMSWSHDEADHTEAIGIEYLDSLYSYALVLSRNHAEAEDLVQETYVRAIQAMGRLRPGSNIKGWLFTILRNVWRNQLRKLRNGPQVVEIEADNQVANKIVEQSADSHDLYLSKVEAEEVRAAIQDLPVDFREIILLREYEDLSYQEIASVMGCRVGTVMSRLARARAKLRDLLCTRRTGFAGSERCK